MRRFCAEQRIRVNGIKYMKKCKKKKKKNYMCLGFFSNKFELEILTVEKKSETKIGSTQI